MRCKDRKRFGRIVAFIKAASCNYNIIECIAPRYPRRLPSTNNASHILKICYYKLSTKLKWKRHSDRWNETKRTGTEKSAHTLGIANVHRPNNCFSFARNMLYDVCCLAGLWFDIHSYVVAVFFSSFLKKQKKTTTQRSELHHSVIVRRIHFKPLD